MTQGPTDPSASPEVPKITPDKTLEKGRRSPDTESFAKYKEEAPSATTPGGISPMDLASKGGISTTPTFETLLAQTINAKDTLNNVENNLKTPNLKLKKSHSELINSKLTSANEHLETPIEKLNGTVPKKTEVPPGASPIARFMGLVLDGQNKLHETHDLIENYKTKGGQLNPGDMLLIQIKLAQAQQEIEYSSVLLSKAVDAFKQIVSIQI